MNAHTSIVCTPRSVCRHLAAAFRSRTGNLLLAINTAVILRYVMLRPPIEWDYPEYWRLVGDPEPYSGDICYFNPPFYEVLYRFAHLPTLAAIKFGEWVLEPLWNHLYVIVAERLEVSLFLCVSAFQWLVVGYLVELYWRWYVAQREAEAPLAAAPEPVQRSFEFR